MHHEHGQPSFVTPSFNGERSDGLNREEIIDVMSARGELLSHRESELEKALARVAALEVAARAVGAPSKIQGARTVLVDFDALIALEDLVPDQPAREESASDGGNVPAREDGGTP